MLVKNTRIHILNMFGNDSQHILRMGRDMPPQHGLGMHAIWEPCTCPARPTSPHSVRAIHHLCCRWSDAVSGRVLGQERLHERSSLPGLLAGNPVAALLQHVALTLFSHLQAQG